MIGVESPSRIRSADDVTPPVAITSGLENRIIVSLSMESEAFGLLMGLVETSGQDLGKVISKSFLLYRAAMEASKEGKAVGIALTSEVLETEFVGI